MQPHVGEELLNANRHQQIPESHVIHGVHHGRTNGVGNFEHNLVTRHRLNTLNQKLGLKAMVISSPW